MSNETNKIRSLKDYSWIQKENIRNLRRSNQRFLNKRCKITDEHILAIKCFIDENSNNIYSLADVKAYLDKFETLSKISKTSIAKILKTRLKITYK